MEAYKVLGLEKLIGNFDLGIPRHIEMVLSGMFPLWKLSRAKTFTLGGSKTHAVKGHGNIELQSTTSKKLVFKNVLYISNLCRNLISVSHVTKKSA